MKNPQDTVFLWSKKNPLKSHCKNPLSFPFVFTFLYFLLRSTYLSDLTHTLILDVINVFM